VAALVARARTVTTDAIGVGLLVPFVSREAVLAAAAVVAVVEFFLWRS
jgi:hypothetical protein